MMLKLEEKFEVGVFLKRLNRFLVEVELDSNRVLAHLPNSGRFVTVLIPRTTTCLRKQSRVGCRTGYDLFAVDHEGVPIIVDTRFSTVAARAAVENRQFEPLRGYRFERQNARVDRALIDLLLKSREKNNFFLRSNALPTL